MTAVRQLQHPMARCGTGAIDRRSINPLRFEKQYEPAHCA